MALYKQAEFAGKCGVSRAYLSVYKKRGYVIIGEDDMVDDANPINAQFLADCEQKALLKGEKKVTPPGKSGAQQEKKAKKPSGTKEQKELHAKAGKKLDLDSRKREIEIQKMQQESLQVSMKNEKMMGKIIPTDVVKALFAQHFRSVTVAFKQGADIIAVEFGKKAKLNRNDMAELKGSLIRVINKAVEESVEESRKSLNSLISDYSKK